MKEKRLRLIDLPLLVLLYARPAKEDPRSNREQAGRVADRPPRPARPLGTPPTADLPHPQVILLRVGVKVINDCTSSSWIEPARPTGDSTPGPLSLTGTVGLVSGTLPAQRAAEF
ncbi:hypothetical protein DFH07DRAFT_779416 [Mycena maculata]|uniref:Secreted protein n=1 Tax=Mycena maculata TaxID=230809 RepID=A0AAD7I9Q1_9AGAR|nr:hypothetical protein DFH07DRAFT_779416 [Mycena maculata]